MRARAAGATRPGAVAVNYWWAEKKWWQSNEIINVAELMMNENKKSRGSLEPASSLAMQSYHILFWSMQACTRALLFHRTSLWTPVKLLPKTSLYPHLKLPTAAGRNPEGWHVFLGLPCRFTIGGEDWPGSWSGGLHLFLLVGGLRGKRCRLRACKWSALFKLEWGGTRRDGSMQTSWGLIS